MYFYDRQISGFQSAVADVPFDYSRLNGLSYGAFGQVGAILPKVSTFNFRNTGTTDAENCCRVCTSPLLPRTGSRLNLGVGLRGNGAAPLRAANGMELAFTIAGHRPGFEYDILRTRRNAIWQRVGGVWSRVGAYDPMGTGDDAGHTDECLRISRTNRIFVIDISGWPFRTLPAPAGFFFTGAAATEVVLRMSAAEWVSARNQAEGIPWTPLELPPFQDGTRRPHIYWHTITWLVRNPAGNPAGTWVLGPRSRIQLGSLPETVINSAPS